MRLKLYRGCLLVFGLLICLPIFAVILGAFKSTRELTEALSPIIGTSGGSVHWRLFPFYPT